MLYLEVERPANKVGTFPANRRVGVTALGADDRLDLEFLGRIDDALHQHACNIACADLDARIGCLERLGRDGPALAGLIHDFSDSLQVLGIVHDLHGRHQHQVFGTLGIHRDLETEILLCMLDLGLDSLDGDTHRTADLDSAGRGADEAFRGITGSRHALAHLANHVDDIIAYRAHHGTAAAEAAGVVDKLLPLLELLGRDFLRQPDKFFQAANERVLLFPQTAHRLELVDGHIARIACFCMKQAGIGAHATVDATAEVGCDRRIDLFPEGVDAPFKSRLAHTLTPFSPAIEPVYQRETNNVNACISLVNGNRIIRSSTERMWNASIQV